MSTVAHLVAFIDTTQTPPTVTRVGVYGEAHPTSDLRRAYPVPLHQFHADTYGEARENALKWLRTAPPALWIFALYDE